MERRCLNHRVAKPVHAVRGRVQQAEGGSGYRFVGAKAAILRQCGQRTEAETTIADLQAARAEFF